MCTSKYTNLSDDQRETVRRKQQSVQEITDNVYARDNERKGHKANSRTRDWVNKAGGEQEREKERAMEGCC